MMGPGDTYHQTHIHSSTTHHHQNSVNPGSINSTGGTAHHGLPMDLHIPQGFPYYRYRNEPFCWTDRKPGIDEMTGHGSMNARQVFEQAARFPPSGHSAPPILELRKEKSRDAARSRRGKENYEFYELAKMLPLPPAITSQLDKASIIRLTISYLRLKDFSAHGDPPWARDNPTSNKKGSRPRSSGNIHLDLFEQHQGTHILQSLDGFAFSLAADGRFLYISETVSIYLGLSQVELTGSSIFDYIHQGDHAELAEQLGLGLTHGPGANVPSPVGSEDGSSNSATNNPDVSSLMSISSNSGYKGPDRAFCIRMKSTLTKRGCHFKSSGYRVVLVLCRLRAQYSFSQSRKAPPPLLGMVAMAIALPPPSVHEIRLETDMFVTRLSFDFKIVHCEPRVSELLDYSADDMLGKNLYAMCHAEDVNKLKKCHLDLLEKGQVMSQYYRLLNKTGGFTWLQICATIVCSSKNSDEQSIICVNYILSGKEYSNMVMDTCQLEQDCLPSAVKREILLDDQDKKSPDHDSLDGNGRGRDSSGGHGIDSTRAPSTRAGPGSQRSPEIRDGCSIREKRANLHLRTGSSRLGDDAISALAENQPLTPISTSTPDHADARTPQSVRSLDSEQFAAAPVKSTKGRKRKIDRKAASISNGMPHTSTAHLESPTTHTSHLESHNHNHSSVCSKRQIIVQNEVNESGRANLIHGGIDGNLSNGILSATNSGAIDHVSSASPLNSSVETDNSGDSSRWRKSSQQQWTGAGTSSVKDLEQVMSKHLPGRENEHAPSIISSSGIDFSTDSLLRQQTGSRSGSAIQWVGPGSQSTPGLPVSALLRQLCASRESVIRANVQAAAAAAVVAARGNSYYPDMNTVQSALPTPPGSDAYINDSQFLLGHHSHQKTTSAEFASLVPYSNYDYQPAMTPPASVSPREKSSSYSASNGESGSGFGDPSAIPVTTSTSFRPPQSYLDSPAQPLPLKPQVYGYHPHSSLESQYGSPLADHSQSQFYPPPHTSFHLYHPGKPSPYGDPLKNSWYSTTS